MLGRWALQAAAVKKSPLPKKKITSYMNQGVQICGYVFRNVVRYINR